MGIRMSGIISGLDTDSIIKELMSAQSLKKTKIENKITKHEWKQEKWKDLNSKIYSFYTGALSKLKKQGTYLSKKVSSSNETKVSVTATSDAVEGSHTVKVNKLASSQYATGAKLNPYLNDEGSEVKVTAATKLKDLGITGGTIKISTEKKSLDFDISEDSTLNDFVNACKSIGLSASYDANQGRLFISSSSSGTSNAFQITAEGASNATQAKNDIRTAAGYGSMTSSERLEIDKAIDNYINSDDNDVKEAAYNKILERLAVVTTANEKAALKTSYYDGSLQTNDPDLYDEMKAAEVEAAQKYTDSVLGSEYAQDNCDAAVDKAISKIAAEHVKELQNEFTNTEDLSTISNNPYAVAAANINGLLEDYIDASENVVISGGIDLGNIGLSEITYTKDAAGNLIYNSDAASDAGVSLVGASNSEIVYNGAVLEGNSNTVTANGITFTVQDETAADETITLTVSKDTDSVYDTIKSILKDYNNLLDELSGAYDAKSARGYDPLTDEEREAMTDEQIEKWETKIKDSLLRRDTTLGSIITTLKDSLAGSVEYNGKSYSLSSFGISSKYYTEKGKLHIAGDTDDSLTAEDADKLKKALSEDPEAVMKVFSNLAQNLYDDFSDKMKTSSLSSALTVYNDKQMSKDLDKYNEELKKMETRLQDLEDRYYKQFTAMEKALSTLNSQSSSLASMMGLSTEK